MDGEQQSQMKKKQTAKGEHEKNLVGKQETLHASTEACNQSSSNSEALSDALLSDDNRILLRTELSQLSQRHREERRRTTLFKSPLRTLHFFAVETAKYGWSAVAALFRHWLLSALVVICCTALVVLRHVEGPHHKVCEAD